MGTRGAVAAWCVTLTLFSCQRSYAAQEYTSAPSGGHVSAVRVLTGSTDYPYHEDKGLPGDWPLLSGEPAEGHWSSWVVARETHHVGFRSKCSLGKKGKALWTLEAKNGPYEGDGWHFSVFDDKKTVKADLPPGGAVILNLPADDCRNHPVILAIHADSTATYTYTVLTYRKNRVGFKGGETGSFFRDIASAIGDAAIQYSQQQAGLTPGTPDAQTPSPQPQVQTSPSQQVGPADITQVRLLSVTPTTVGPSDTVTGRFTLFTTAHNPISWVFGCTGQGEFDVIQVLTPSKVLGINGSNGTIGMAEGIASSGTPVLITFRRSTGSRFESGFANCGASARSDGNQGMTTDNQNVTLTVTPQKR